MGFKSASDNEVPQQGAGAGAGAGAGVGTPASAPAKTVKKSDAEKARTAEFLAEGARRLDALTAEGQARIGELSTGVLTVECGLGFQSKLAPRVGKRALMDAAEAAGDKLKGRPLAGIRVRALQDVVVPEIPLRKDVVKTGFNKDEIGQKVLKKGQVADLTIFEAFLLMSHPQFAGTLPFKDGSKTVNLRLKYTSFFSEENKLPTPALNLSSGSLKAEENSIAVDIKVGDKWEMRPEFKEKFGILMEKVTPTRTADKTQKKEKYTTAQLCTSALFKILGDQGADAFLTQSLAKSTVKPAKAPAVAK